MNIPIKIIFRKKDKGEELKKPLGIMNFKGKNSIMVFVVKRIEKKEDVKFSSFSPTRLNNANILYKQ